MVNSSQKALQSEALQYATIINKFATFSFCMIHFQTIVKLWHSCIVKAHLDKKLTFLYLANDVVQNSRKKYPDFSSEFGTVVKNVLEHLACLPFEEKTVGSINRLLIIWRERSIFDDNIQTDLGRIWAKKQLESKANASDASSTSPSSAKKARKGI